MIVFSLTYHKGVLIKESKESSGSILVDGMMNQTGIRKTNKKRWCMLISAKPIVREKYL